ncbi:MAG TPA: carboxypeptidase regulatory-like domain-containing protein [Solirubrobacteraceae bacterium]|nr:carboxypeptidase regulatory-like domain-containing protein [Solirubrobacteraceae bacterium]
MARRSFIAAIAASLALAALAVAARAYAGQYHVYSCRTPAGESAPADGWGGSHSGPYTYAQNSCAQSGGALLAALGDEPARTANTDLATWTFAAPAGATIAAATLWRAGDADGGAAVNATYEFWFAGPRNLNDPQHAFGWCVGGAQCPSGLGDPSHPLGPENRVTAPSANLGPLLFVDASCVGESGFNCPTASGDPNAYAAAVYVYAADITLEQNAGPNASGVSGELASAASVKGSSAVAFSASDPGAGVYEAVFNVDGQVMQSSVVDDNGGRCRDVGQSADGRPAFLYVQPCQASVSVDVPFDTTRLSNGAHHLIVSVIDAAGNAAPVLDRQITVANPPPACAPGAAQGTSASAQGTLSAGWQGTRKPLLTSAYGRRQTIVGRLTGPGGAPMAGAQIELVAIPSGAGAVVALASPRTQADGRFSVRLPARLSSRKVCLSYRGAAPGATPALTRTLTLRVHAGIALRVSPRTASVGRSIHFRGRLLGGPVPASGKHLVLEARSPGSGWIEFKVVHTDARGRYHAAYRFKFAGPADYRFRVRSEVESGYPFAGGSSNVVRVRER